MVAGVELNYNSSATATQMAETIFGDGVTVVGATYTGFSGSSAIYSGGDSIAPNTTPSDTGVILSTGYASTYTSTGSQSNVVSNASTNTPGPSNEPGFNALAGTSTYDASYLDIDFIPTGDVMTMQFVFASDEYPEYSNSIYNDTVGVWINGSNVPMSVGDGSAAVGNVNQSENFNLYLDNTNDAYNTEMDGLTVTLTLTIPVTSGVVNSIRIGIADTSDSSYDSNLLIAADSVQTSLVAGDDTYTIGHDFTKTVDLLDNDLNNTAGSLQITHINGVQVYAGDTVTLATGHEVHLNSDGTVDIKADDDTELVNFTYTVASLDSNDQVLETDVGIVTLDTIPCFTAGTRILTVDGNRTVEDLEPGDMVVTQDDGAQPVRWIGRRKVPAYGKMAPVRIAANALGSHGSVTVSPLHRILVADHRAELLFGEPEVLVAARDLVNDRTIRAEEGGMVEYVHLMFDRHQVVFTEGLASESFFPGTQTMSAFEEEVVEEITTIFPELDPASGAGYSPAARCMLKRYEGAVLGGFGEGSDVA